MSKSVLYAIVGMMLVIFSAFAYVVFVPGKDDVNTSDSERRSSGNDDVVTVSDKPGAYTDYSEDAVANADGTRLLFFHASWCPQCKEMDASIKESSLPNGVTIFKVDYDSNQALRQKYGVTIQTTFVKIDDNGNKVASYVAYDEPRFSAVERELLR